MSARRFFRSRPWLLWTYGAVGVVLLFTLMYLVADRYTPQSTATPAGTSAVDAEMSEEGEPTNEFVPADRDVSECISAVPKPGCGSEARGGWRQTLVLVTILVGLALIVWRIVVGARRAREEQLARS